MKFSRVPGDDNLYIGGVKCLAKETLQSAAITHIVSVLKYDYSRYEHLKNYEHLLIEKDDIQSENLLENFEKTGAWIEEALRGGRDGKQSAVLVHCAIGISRSVTIVLAYLLRKNPNLEVSETLSLVRRSRPLAQPNDGFMAQLKLYKEMGCPTNIDTNLKYQHWIYQKQNELAHNSGVPPQIIRFIDEIPCDKQQKLAEREVEIKCRKCRRVLATTPYMTQHSPMTSQPLNNTGLFSAPINSAQSLERRTTCTSHFVHPLSWMRPILEQGMLMGRLECPNIKCSCIVGRYSWQGQRCSCKTWVCPAFSLQKSRCDEILVSKSRQ